MKKWLNSALCAFSMVCVPDVSVMATTNRVAIMINTNESVNDSLLVGTEKSPNTFWKISESEFNKRITLATADSFDPQSIGGYVYAEEAGANLRIVYNNAGKNVIQQSIANSLRESFLKFPGISNLGDWTTTLIAGSIGWTSEQSVKPSNRIPKASLILWWQEMRDNKIILYGVRPNYSYAGFNVGHLDDGPLATEHVSLRYDPFKVRSSLEEQLAIFLPCSTILMLGGSYGVFDINNRDHQLDYFASISHPLGNKWNENMFSIAVTTNQHGWLADFQITKTF